jgi:hypothetical protein
VKLIVIITFLMLVSCGGGSGSSNGALEASGIITDQFGNGVSDIKVYYNESDFVVTDRQGEWNLSASEKSTITPIDSHFSFSPAGVELVGKTQNISFEAQPVFSADEWQIISWMNNQQLSNGLLESSENSNFVSLYDNALAAMVFMLVGDFDKAEAIFDFFDAKVDVELLSGVGGFSQFRDRNGVPTNLRWMGDNAWLLIALNNYHAATNSARYQSMSSNISDWLKSLQDTDGGLYAGYQSDDSLLDYKVTEGNIDAYNAILGYQDFHSNLLNFLINNRWDNADNNLMAWPENPDYRYAIDNHSWAYCIFNDYPISALHSAERFISTHTATVNGRRLTGYDIDEDKDTVFIEGTGQMALAFNLAGLYGEGDFYLGEMEKVLIQSEFHSDSMGFPYASNRGTGYGNTDLWEGVDTEIALSGGAWYLFAKSRFNPFGIGRKNTTPRSAMFWLAK